MTVCRNAWVTLATDEASATEAVVLAKSLSRVVTSADTIVLTPLEMPVSIGQILAQYFDVVIPVEVGKKGVLIEDQLKMRSLNLGMYRNIVVLEPRAMVLKNCDELFDMDGDFHARGNSSGFDSKLFVMKPSIGTYKKIVQLVNANGKLFGNFSEIIREYLPKNCNMELAPIYNFGIPDLMSNPTMYLDDVKIFTFGHLNCLEESNNAKSPIIEEMKNKWFSLHKELQAELSAINLNTDMENDLKGSDIKTPNKSYYKNSTAIVGYSCRFPGCNNSAEFWNLLKTGGDGIVPYPQERLTEKLRRDPEFKKSKGGFLKCPIDEFDAKFFEISPREASFMDPQQRLLCEVAWEALENGGIDPHSLKRSNTGVFSGVWTLDYEHFLNNENTNGENFHHTVLGNTFSAAAARVSYFLGLNGPNIATESGCSSSMVALHLACESLQRGETEMGLVMGSNIILSRFPLTDIPILAKDGHCKTFDEKADGFGRAEGVAVIVLKRLSDAISNNDRILGIIRGTGMSQEGTSSSFGTPSKFCQEIAIKNAITKAGVTPGEVDYVEAHGTGTAVGDPTEFAALSAGYAGEREKPLIIGSVKTNIGHTEATSGLAGIIKVLLAMEHEMIPPHRNFDILNPAINLETIPSMIPLESVEWPRMDERVRIAGISSFGISGANVHAILEEPPKESFFLNEDLKLVDSERSHHILTLSGKTENALKDLSKKYIQYFQENPDVDIANVSFTANCGRAHLKFRQTVVGKTIQELKSSLELNSNVSTLLNSKPKIGFLFTGQGSQYFGMAKHLYMCNSVFQNSFNNCAVIVRNNHGISLHDALWNESQNSLLDETIYSQLTIFAIEYSLLKLWESLGIKPDLVLGHSVGEFAAVVAANILTLEEVIALLSERSRLIQKLPGGGMLAVYSSKEITSELIDTFLERNSGDWLDIAVINSPFEVVVAGNKETLVSFADFCKSRDIKSKMLAASHAFHSRAMEGAMDEFGTFAKCLTFKSPECQYISGTTGNILHGNEMDGSYWQTHATGTVNFLRGTQTLTETGCNVFIEIGAHPVLLALCMANIPHSENYLWLPSIRRNDDNFNTLLQSLGKLYTNGVNINWEALDKCVVRSKVELPTYPFQRQKYWIENNEEVLDVQLHPLLGRKVMLANLKDIVYEHTWRIKDLKYLRDHKVANLLVFPGAGFLEMIIAAGKDILLKNEKGTKKVLSIENFVIESPLELAEEKRHKVQVVASPVENEAHLNKFHVRIYVHQKLNGYNDEKGWKQYSHAYIYLSDNETAEIDNLENIKSRCSLESGSSEFYQMAPELGIYFGDTFQSIETMFSGENEVLSKVPLPSKAGNLEDYIYHPIVLDAMFQTFGISLLQENLGLYLPVGVNQFKMTSQNMTFSKHYYVHTKWEKNQKSGNVALYSDTGILLGMMEGVRLFPTSVSSFLSLINSQNNLMPGMYEQTWVTKDGPLQSRVDLQKFESAEALLESLNKSMEGDMKAWNPGLAILMDELLGNCLLYNFSEIGWSPNVADIYSTDSFMQTLCFSYSHANYVERLLDIICECGFSEEILLENQDTKHWQITKPLPSLEQSNLTIESLNGINSMFSTEYIEKVLECCQKIVRVLQGHVSAVSELFDTSSGGFDITSVYSESPEFALANIRMGKFLKLLCNPLTKGGEQENAIIRIVEIGGGNGATTKEILNQLQNAGIRFRYTFTDISISSCENAKNQFSDYSGVEYKVLDIEKDPAMQGFCPNHYDIVIASNTINATEDLRNSMENVRSLLVSNGMFLMQELLRPSKQIDILFGILEGYWKFTDYDIRENHPCVSQNVWNKVFLETNFAESVNLSRNDEMSSVLCTTAGNANLPYKNWKNNIVSEVSIQKSPAWLVFCDESSIHADVLKNLFLGRAAVVKVVNTSGDSLSLSAEKVYLNFSDANQVTFTLDKLTEEFNVTGIIYSVVNDRKHGNFYLETLNIFKYFSTNNKSEMQFVVISRGSQCTPNQGAVIPVMAPILNMLKSLANEERLINAKLIDLDPDYINKHAESQEIFYELFSKEDIIVCYRKKKRLLSKFRTMKKPMAPLSLPQGRYQIDIPKSKRINDVAFRSYPETDLKPEEIEVAVKAMALNFRDIFVILKPEGFKSTSETVGSEFAGVVTKIGSQVKNHKVGDEVFGFYEVSCAASHVVVPYDQAIPKPKHYSFAEAATLPIVFSTAWHSIVDLGKLQRGETILIHVASGGVGLIAVQIAKYLGAKIIATAGNPRKRNYLKSIGIEHVFNSRDLSFSEDIEKATGGKGVDMVLNSLTGPGFVETSLKSCSEGARFVEIGKVGIWKHEDIQKVRPDVKYTIFDLETSDKEIKILNTLVSVIEKNIISPLPYTRFEIPHIRDALLHLSKAQHIGKIVLGIPELKETDGLCFNKDLIFNNTSSYLITGGLGGIGLEVAKWMVDCGARNLILVGRSKPNESTLAVLNDLRIKGSRILDMQVDVGDFNACKKLFYFISNSDSKLPPLKGVMHSAGVLSDGLYVNQSWEKYHTTFNPKINGAWNLHKLTKDMNLEHFVLFSSMSAIFGPLGQSNHSAANGFLDALAHYRHSIGLPAQTINWGAWSQIGTAANTTFGKEGAFGLKPITPEQGIAALKFIVTSPNITQLGVIEMNCAEMKQANFLTPNIAATIINESEKEEIIQTSSSSSVNLQAEIGHLSFDDRVSYFKSKLEDIIRKTLKFAETESIDGHQNFSELGLDSLMAVEMKNTLQTLVGTGISLNATSMLDHPTINSLSKYLADETWAVLSKNNKNDEESGQLKQSDSDTILELIKKDSILPAGIKNVSEISVEKESVKTILLTGSTGHLGAYVLKDLLENKSLKVICLIRGRDIENARNKLIKNLEKYKLNNIVDAENIPIVVGNISDENLGISIDEYENLCKEVDCVFHLAAKVTHMEPYRVTKSNIGVRSINVIGTLNVLKFCSTSKTKRLVFASTYPAINRLTPDGFASDEFPDEDNYGDGIREGYFISKFVCEKLLKAAISRGIPCSGIRYPVIVGDSVTGQFTVETNLVMNIAMSSSRLGVFPHIKGGFNILPVDVASKLTLELVFNEDAQPEMYNLLNPVPVYSEDVVEVAVKTGYNMSVVDENTYFKAFEKEAEINPFFKLYADHFGNDMRHIVKGLSNTLQMSLFQGKSIYRFSDKFMKVIPDVNDKIPNIKDILYNYFANAEQTGIFKNFGINPSTIS